MIPYAEDVDQGSEYDNKEKQAKWYDLVLLNRPSKVVLALFLTAVIAPTLVYQYMVTTSLDLPPSDGYSFGSCLVPRASRLRCGQGNVTQARCHPQCCYDLSNFMCYQRLPSRFSYIMDRNWTEETELHPRVATEPFTFQPSIQTIRLSIDEVSRTHLTLSFYNTEIVDPQKGSRLNETDYSYEISSPELNVQVESAQRIIFSTMRGPLIAAEDIWEITFKLTNETMFGLGEIPLKENTVKIIYSHRDGLETVPLIFSKSNGSYHGFLIDIPFPTEVAIQGNNQVMVRSITSAELKFHLFVGPEPKDVMRDVMEFIGFENTLEYWMLGAHICNSMADDTPQMSLEKLRQFVAEGQSESVPYDSHCGLGALVFDEKTDEERDARVRDGVATIKGAGRRFVPHLAPYIKYNGTNETTFNNTLFEFEGIFLRDPSGQEIYFGSAHGDRVVYPDYENDTSKALLEYLWKLSAETDGIVLQNNWPLDDSPKRVNETGFYLPYFNWPFQTAFNHTPQWNATKPNGDRHLYSHSKYGNHFCSTIKNVTDGRHPIWTSSQWMNGKVIVNRQDKDISWTNLRRELIETALNGISGHWFSMSPICGDTGNFNIETQTTLCVNWYHAATYLPLIKVHSTDVERHPLAFNGNNRAFMLYALQKRLSLLPYFYTTLQNGPLLRPMFYQFPQADSLENTTTQFSVGDDLLVVPNLLPNQSHVNIWMPPGTWYELWYGLKISAEEGDAAAMSTTDADILTLVRGGAVVFLQKNVSLTAEATRRKASYQLVVAFTQSSDLSTQTQPRAEGQLFVTKDLTVKVTADSEKLIITHEGDDLSPICSEEAVSARVIEAINVYGLPEGLNNYDHHREAKADIDLCALQNGSEIVFNFISESL